MLLDQLLNAKDLAAAESATVLETDRFEPELGNTVVAFHMNMYGLVPVTGIKEEAIRACPKDRRH